MSTLRVDAIRHNSATSDAITTASDGTCTARITGMTGGGGLSHRNIMDNGAMLVAQRGAAAAQVDGIGSVDRFKLQQNSVTNHPTQSQVDVASGTTPYSLGFRKALKLINGSNTVGTDDILVMKQVIEAQNMASSGWNYTSDSSFITLQFWIKSSVAQNFYFYLRTYDGTGQIYPMETGSLSADTWTKITKTIPGNSNLQFDNDANAGIEVTLNPYLGTDRTDAGVSLNAWAAYGSGTTRTPNQTSTWYTTNSATLEFTGYQLEVGDTATSFEHRSRGDELAHCQRYCVVIGADEEMHLGTANAYNSTNINLSMHVPVAMRAKPTASVVLATSGDNANKWLQAYMGATGNKSNASISVSDCSGGHAQMRLYLQNAHSGLSVGQALWCHTLSDAKLILSAEL